MEKEEEQGEGGGGDSESNEDDNPTIPLAKVVEHDNDYDKGGYDNDVYNKGEGGRPASTINGHGCWCRGGHPPPSSHGVSPHTCQHSHRRHEAVRRPSCGFAKPSSPQPGSAEKKSSGRAWQLFNGWGLATAMTTMTASAAPAAETTAPAAETMAPGGGDGS